MKLLVVTNILTPYRMSLFAELNRQLSVTGGTLNVVAMAETEPDRAWRYGELQMQFTTLLRHVTITIRGIHTHFTLGLGRIISKYQPDVIICAGSYTAPTVWQVLLTRQLPGRSFRAMFWSESHLHQTTGRSFPLKLAREILRRIVYRGFDGFLYAGQLSRNFIRKYAVRDAQMVSLPNTVDNKFYDQSRERLAGQQARLRSEYGIPRDKFVFITPARLTRAKGVDKMLDLARTMERRRDTTFVVCGSGEQEPALRSQGHAYGIDLRLLGHRTIDEVAELYALADCFLLPSISDPNPLSVVEALWSGLPLLVSSQVGNHPETVQVGVNGYVFDYADPTRATQLFDRMAGSDATWRACAGTASLAIARDRFDEIEVVQTLLQELAGSDSPVSSNPLRQRRERHK